MNSGRNEKKIRELAYTIWEAEGRPLGQAERHWNMARGLAEADSEQSMLGQHLSGDNFLGDSVNSGELADILADNREYAEVAQDLAQASPSDGQQRPQSKVQQQVVQGSASRGSSAAESKNKKRPGKKKSSDNILV